MNQVNQTCIPALNFSKMKNVPAKIYLQIDADGETPENFKELEGITWCSEKINQNDIEYIQADLSIKSNIDIKKEILDVALRTNNIQLSDHILSEVCRIIKILSEKGGNATIKDVIKKDKDYDYPGR